MNNEHLLIIFITTLLLILLIFGVYCLILLKRSKGGIKDESGDEYEVSPIQATRVQSKNSLTARQIQERERLLQLVRARVQANRREAAGERAQRDHCESFPTPTSDGCEKFLSDYVKFRVLHSVLAALGGTK
jgi:hypothetical protein